MVAEVAYAVAVISELASRETDIRVRSQLASTAKRIGSDCGLAVAVVMLAADRSEDREDPHLPLLLWWAIEAHADDENAMLEDALASMPELWASQLFTGTVLERLARRCGMVAEPQAFALCETALAMAPTDDLRQVLVRGFDEGLASREAVQLPESLAALLAEARAASPVADILFRLRQGEEGAEAAAVAMLADRGQLAGDRVQLIEVVAQQQAAGGGAALTWRTD